MNNYDDIKRFKEKLNMENVDYKEIAESGSHISSSNWAIIKQVATADAPFHPLEQGHSTLPPPSQVDDNEFSARPPMMPAAAPYPLPPTPAHAPGVASSFAQPLFHAVEKALPPKGSTQSATVPLTTASGATSVFQQLESMLAPHRPALPVQSSLAPPATQALLDQLRQQAPSQPAATARTEAPAGNTLFDRLRQQTPSQPARAEAPAGHKLFGVHVAPTVQRKTTPLFHDDRADNAPTATTDGRFKNLFSRRPHPSEGIAPDRTMSLSLLLENIALCR